MTKKYSPLQMAYSTKQINKKSYKVDRLHLLPISHQVSTALRDETDLLANGAKFMTEREVSERFGVCRSTAAKAINQLVTDDTLYRSKCYDSPKTVCFA